eukprot:NODE_2822_length_736_cov_249.145560_g1987_i0.p2 GENE.NODE_2822_length_736_cov_249.145560_g1987_i0~~NODE_2822_length_736_cov_249.145560_g1987_i0.p2  ORF type:complete len:157 (-),score=46.90 NODE_2822_length_736_cov_249.145560_g1987_i0:264-704(-)
MGVMARSVQTNPIFNRTLSWTQWDGHRTHDYNTLILPGSRLQQVVYFGPYTNATGTLYIHLERVKNVQTLNILGFDGPKPPQCYSTTSQCWPRPEGQAYDVEIPNRDPTQSFTRPVKMVTQFLVGITCGSYFPTQCYSDVSLTLDP